MTLTVDTSQTYVQSRPRSASMPFIHKVKGSKITYEMHCKNCGKSHQTGQWIFENWQDDSACTRETRLAYLRKQVEEARKNPMYSNLIQYRFSHFAKWLHYANM